MFLIACFRQITELSIKSSAFCSNIVFGCDVLTEMGLNRSLRVAEIYFDLRRRLMIDAGRTNVCFR